jgi:hypothetical protein
MELKAQTHHRRPDDPTRLTSMASSLTFSWSTTWGVVVLVGADEAMSLSVRRRRKRVGRSEVAWDCKNASGERCHTTISRI